MIPNIDEATNQAERLAHTLDSLRHTHPGLTESDKEEIWEMVLALTGMSSALWRIGVLSKPD
jgi:hypothetical protein